MPKKLLLVSALLLGTIVYGRDFNPRKVVLNLATISDTHVNGYQTVPARKFRSALEQERDYEQIILSRPTVILGNQDIGFLPGDQKSKMSPFLQPLMDNLNVIKEQFRPGSREAQRIEAMLTMEKLVIEPLAYIRGRSLGKCFFIIDEAQNLTPHEIKTIITRAGEGTKMVFTGDVFQIDQPYLDQWTNGLSHIAEKLSGQKLFEHVFLRKGERSALSDLAAKLL